MEDDLPFSKTKLQQVMCLPFCDKQFNCIKILYKYPTEMFVEDQHTRFLVKLPQ